MARTTDALYLRESRYREPKESFKFCLRLAREWGFAEGGAVHDIGCAAGEFEYYLREQLPTADLHGVEYLPELVDKARAEVSGVTFRQGSALDLDLLPPAVSDMTFMVGVHSIFEDPLPAFDNMIRWTKPGGGVLIFGLFNRYPIDTFVALRRAADAPDHRESGWNMISQATVSKFLNAHPDVAEHRFTEFALGIDLPHQEDPIRSWTVRQEGGPRLVVNGSGLIHDFHALQIRKR